MKVLISGGTGFTGQAITHAVLKRGHAVRILSRSEAHTREIFRERHPEHGSHPERSEGPLEIAEGDVTRPETLPAAVDGIEVVIQCAQFPGHPVENPRRGFTYWNVDALGTENLAKAAKEATVAGRAKVEHIIYISGAGVSSKRHEPWFKAKWYAEAAIHGTGIRATILRPSVVFGPGDKSINRLIQQIRRFPVVPMIGGGGNHLQPIFVEDLAGLVAQCVGDGCTEDRVFEIGGPQEFTMKKLLQILMKLVGKKRFLLPLPKPLVKLAAWPLQFLPTPPLSPSAVDFLSMDVRLDLSPFCRLFPNTRFKTLENGLRSYLKRG